MIMVRVKVMHVFKVRLRGWEMHYVNEMPPQGERNKRVYVRVPHILLYHFN